MEGLEARAVKLIILFLLLKVLQKGTDYEFFGWKFTSSRASRSNMFYFRELKFL